jgi:nitroimidazol reductase NimA-like FMN-containing flavoprotein (pyridoxamine 5'-phosphate oxidase superfamily)
MPWPRPNAGAVVRDREGEAVVRTSITRLAELASADLTELYRLLDSSRVGHFALVADSQPVVIPTAIARDGASVLAHGSTGSVWMRRLAEGGPTSLGVTSLDGLVVARSAFESSMHYRSAVLFGRCRPVDDPEEKQAALDVITESLLAGRVAEVREPTAKELAATLVLRLPIDEWSLKVSAGWPDDPATDVAGGAWAGIVPISSRYGTARPAPDLREDVALPPSVRRLTTEETG